MDNAPTLAEAARTLVAQAQVGVLSTLEERDAVPYGSIVELAATADGDILLLLSRLAEHRRYLDADSRASLLIAPELQAPGALARPRVTLLGQAGGVGEDAQASEIYLARHPHAARYLALGDFHFYRLRVERARFIAGFGRMGWLDTQAYRAAAPDPLWAVAAGAIVHMNADHRDSLLLYLRCYADAGWADTAELLHLDSCGLDIEASAGARRETLRIAFDPPLLDPAELRPRLIDMSRRARGAPGED